MTEVLVLVEHSEGAVKKVTAELITAARALGEPSAVVIGGPGTAAPLVEDLKAAGAAKIYVAESDDAENYLITPFVDVLESLIESASPAAVLIPATADGKEIAGLLAARIGSGLLCDVVDIKSDGTAIHSIFGGAFTVEAKSETDVPVITVRPGAIEPAPVAAAGELVTVAVPAPAANATRIISRQPAVAGDRPELAEAAIQVPRDAAVVQRQAAVQVRPCVREQRPRVQPGDGQEIQLDGGRVQDRSHEHLARLHL
jgi:electron transfer flavoprotein alpha subunit